MKHSTIQRKTPLRAKGGRRFPKRHQPKFWLWLGRLARSGDVLCELDGSGCYYGLLGYPERAHIIPRSQGGDDIGNTVLLCHGHHLQLDNHKLPDATVAFLKGRARRYADAFGTEPHAT